MKNNTVHNLAEEFFTNLTKNNTAKKPEAQNQPVRFGKRHIIIVASITITLLVISFLCWHNAKSINDIAAQINYLNQHDNQLKYALKLKQLLDKKSRSIFLFSLYNKQKKATLDKIIAANIKNNVASTIQSITYETLLQQFLSGQILECLNTFKTYLILAGIENPDKDSIHAWYNNNLHTIASRANLSVNEAILLQPYIEDQIPNVIEIDLDLYNKIISYFQTNIFPNILFQYLNSIINKTDGHLSDLVPKNLTHLFDSQIYDTNIEYIYTKKGYADLKKIFAKFASCVKSINHLNAILGNNYIEDINKELEDIFLSNYQANWNNVLKRLKYAPIRKLDSCTINLKHIADDISGVIHVIEQVEAKMLIMQPNLNNLKRHVPQNVSEVKDAQQNLKNNLAHSIYEAIIEYTPIKKANISELKNTIETNLESNLAEISAISIINNPQAKYTKVLEKITGEESFIKKSLQVAKLLPNPLNEMHSHLIKDIENLLKAEAKELLNSVWKKNVYTPCKEQIANKYPFNPVNYQNQLSLDEFHNFFGPEGKVALFRKNYLAHNAFELSDNAKNALKVLDNVTKYWFNKDGDLNVTFVITNLQICTNLKSINCTLLNKPLSVKSNFNEPVIYTLEKGLEGVAKMEFIGKKKNQISHLSYIGPWGWYKMLRLDTQSLTPIQHLNKTISSPIGDVTLNLYFKDFFMPLPKTLQNIIPKTIT